MYRVRYKIKLWETTPMHLQTYLQSYVTCQSTDSTWRLKSIALTDCQIQLTPEGSPN